MLTQRLDVPVPDRFLFSRHAQRTSPMPIDTSEQDLEATLEAVLISEPGEAASEPTPPYDAHTLDAHTYAPGGYRTRSPADYNRERCLIADDLFDFVVATQPQEWRKLKDQFGPEAKNRFIQQGNRFGKPLTPPQGREPHPTK